MLHAVVFGLLASALCFGKLLFYIMAFLPSDSPVHSMTVLSGHDWPFKGVERQQTNLANK